MVEIHTSGALYHRLENKSGDFVVMVDDDLLEAVGRRRVPFVVERTRRLRRKPSRRQSRAEQAVHTRHRVTYRHSIPRVTVVARADSHKVGLVLVACATERCLYRHLHSNFYRHRTGVGIEYVVHVRRQDFEQHFA